MGLCKCRVVTNLFCFEHKTNVCEKCIVSTHARCVVKSYLQWLQDSDYDANCGLCRKSLQEGEILRLTCLDLYHRACLDQYAQTLPEHTAPAGYACPSCAVPLIPPEKASSPIAVNIRQVLRSSAWAKPILGVQEAIKENGHVEPAITTIKPSEKVAERKPATAVSGQAVSSRKQPSVPSPVIDRTVSAVPVDEDDELHKYKQRRGYLTRLLLMTFWRPNKQGDLVLHMPRLLMFLFLLSIVVVVGFVYYQDESASAVLALQARSQEQTAASNQQP